MGLFGEVEKKIGDFRFEHEYEIEYESEF